MAYTIKLAYTPCITCRISVSAIHKADFILNTRAGKSIMRTSMIPRSRTKNDRREIVQQLLIALWQPPPMDESILHHLCLGGLSVFILFEVAPHVRINILYGTQLFDRFICANFPSEREVASWHSRLVAVLACIESSHNTRTASNVLQDPDKNVDQYVQNKANLDVVGLVRQTLPQPDAQHHILVSTKSHNSHTSEPRVVSFSSHHTSAARGVTNMPPTQPFYILLINFYNRHVRVLKHLLFTQCALCSEV